MARARLALAGLFLACGGVAVSGDPPPALRCPLLDERGAPSPRGALLRLLGGPEASPAPDPQRDPENAFDVIDPLGVLGEFWGPSREPPRCELSPTVPLLPPPGMSPGSPRCHPGLGMRWWLLALGTPEGEGTALLQQGGGDPPLLNVSLLVSTRTPRTQALLGAPGRLHCAFAPPAGPFTLQWLQHRHGATRRLLAFDSAAAHRTEAVPGVLLFLGGHGSPPSASQSSQPSRGTREVSLQLPPLSVSDDGAFVCSVSALHGQVQQVLQLHVIAPPRVSLLPSRLSPGVLAELRCDAVGFFPLDVEIRWERRTHGHTWPYLGDTSGDTPGTTLGPSWSSGHRRAADGTFSRSAGLRVAAVAPGDSYSCLVTHVAWNVPHRVTVVVAGEGHLGTHLGTSGTRCHRAQRGGHGGDGPGGLRHRGAQPEPVALGGEVTPVSPMSPVSPFISELCFSRPFIFPYL
nr:tapasin isoform X2 [Taeniopygia guttata]